MAGRKWLSRASGVLLPVFSLPGPGGIGCFSSQARQFIDLLAEAGQKWWQILPLGTTGFGDSPYQSFSSYAGNLYFIDPEELLKQGLLQTDEVADYYDRFSDSPPIDYGRLFQERNKLLRLAFSRYTADASLHAFIRREETWLQDYALFMTIKEMQGGLPWTLWPERLRDREGAALAEVIETSPQEYHFHIWAQFEFQREWRALKAYANERKVEIIGDLPIYAANDSADVWANRHLFDVAADGQGIMVSGCPPDSFSPLGQLWGNPIYKWEVHEAEGYKWWKARLAYCFELYDAVRIDHFRGIESFYQIPAEATSALEGSWVKGPGRKFFDALDPDGSRRIIAEDLGYLTPEVRELLAQTGYPGMKIIEFAFDSREEGNYLPYTYVPNSVVYTGTHDNEPLLGWYRSLNRLDKARLYDYIGIEETSDVKVCDMLLTLSFSSVSDLCVTPLYDLMFLGNEARINTPSTVGTNWGWRMAESDLEGPSWAALLARKTKIYGRI